MTVYCAIAAGAIDPDRSGRSRRFTVGDAPP